MKQTFEGQGGISATIIADSVSSVTGKRITTFELIYPRFIHSEFMTHRLFSRNAASSRAIPVDKTIELIRQKPAMPIHWGKNQAGMQASGETSFPVWLYHEKGVEFTDDPRQPVPATSSEGNHTQVIGVQKLRPYTREQAWEYAARSAAHVAEQMSRAGYHKQIVNRLLEPFQFMKTVMTSTELENWFWLRDHGDAQPEIAELAGLMRQARESSHPRILQPGEWHVPYVGTARNINTGKLMYGHYEVPIEHDNVPHFFEMPLEVALKVSSSCCAQVSFRKSDESIDKAVRIYDRLVESEPVHASPFEHQATPIDCEDAGDGGQISVETNWTICLSNREGVTHIDKDGNLWSGNFRDWIQHRQLIPNHTQEG